MVSRASSMANPCTGLSHSKNMSQRIDRFAEILQSDIVSCPNDQPCEGGEPVCWITGSSLPVMDLLRGHDVPESLWDDVVCKLRCPKCDSQIEIPQDVGVKPQSEISHEQRIEKALNRHSRKLHEFAQSLKTTPYLGALHSTGKRIVQEIGAFTETSLTNENWFRARRVDSPAPMTTDDLRPPDPKKHKISEGRFHHFGQACWYLADDSKTAAAEATSSGETLAWVQAWKIERLSKVLDLRPWQADDDRVSDHDGEPVDIPLLPVALIFGDHLSAKPDRESNWRPEYFVPRFVADAARRAGFSGILFQSTRFYGKNLVIFDPLAALLPVGSPKLIVLDRRDTAGRDGMFLYQGFPISVSDLSGIDCP